MDPRILISDYGNYLESYKYKKTSQVKLDDYIPPYKLMKKIDIIRERDRKECDENGIKLDGERLRIHRENIAKKMLTTLTKTDIEIEKTHKENYEKLIDKRTNNIRTYFDQLRLVNQKKLKEMQEKFMEILSPKYELRFKKSPSYGFSKLGRFGSKDDLKPLKKYKSFKSLNPIKSQQDLRNLNELKKNYSDKTMMTNIGSLNKLKTRVSNYDSVRKKSFKTISVDTNRIKKIKNIKISCPNRSRNDFGGGNDKNANMSTTKTYYTAKKVVACKTNNSPEKDNDNKDKPENKVKILKKVKIVKNLEDVKQLKAIRLIDKDYIFTSNNKFNINNVLRDKMVNSESKRITQKFNCLYESLENLGYI